MKKIIIIFIVSFLTFVLLVDAKSPCKETVEKRIANLIEGDFSKNMADYLTDVSKEKDNLLLEMRMFNCELEKICMGVDHSRDFIKQSGGMSEDVKKVLIESFSVPAVCYAVYPEGDERLSYKLEDFEGENALCPMTLVGLDAEYSDADNTCEKLKKKYINTSFVFIDNQPTISSKQDEANYYSAKLINFTVRLKKLGDVFAVMNNSLARVYALATCSCSR